MNERARALWARTRLHVWPERYWLVSLPPAALPEAAFERLEALISSCRG